MKGWNGKVTQGSDELKAGGSGEAQSTAFIRSPVGLTSKQLIRLPDRPHCYTHFFIFYFLVLVLLQELRFATALTYMHSTCGFLNDPKAPGGSLEMLAEEKAGRFSFCLWTFIHFCCMQLRTGFLAQPLPSVVFFLSPVLDLWANESVQCLLHPSLLFSTPSEKPRTLGTASFPSLFNT